MISFYRNSSRQSDFRESDYDRNDDSEKCQPRFADEEPFDFDDDFVCRMEKEEDDYDADDDDDVSDDAENNYNDFGLKEEKRDYETFQGRAWSETPREGYREKQWNNQKSFGEDSAKSYEYWPNDAHGERTDTEPNVRNIYLNYQCSFSLWIFSV